MSNTQHGMSNDEVGAEHVNRKQKSESRKYKSGVRIIKSVNDIGYLFF